MPSPLTSDFGARAGAALVAGGSGGVGGEVCRMLAARGSAVALTYRSRPEAADAIVAAIEAEGGTAAAFRADLADEASVRALVDAARERFGAIHTYVHAAGPTVHQLHLSRVEPALLRDHLEAEAAAFFNAVSPLLEDLRAARGSIVAVTTAATDRFAVRDGLSAVPKAAVELLVRGLAVEEGRFGVRANCVGPGMLEDGMAATLVERGDLDEAALDAARANIPLRSFGTAKDIAEAVCFLASDRARYITAQCIDVDGGYAA
ncbi:MAG TPA: SDR family oxidoreductase [Solirubrobacterales bacterium]|jgi:NAD(P)-dependent dehydrogenase (short-subunit alcohol dehydrogenase family)|nr:SDR family oxidoreductase [Solirubrobacterales bacterium]